MCPARAATSHILLHTWGPIRTSLASTPAQTPNQGSTDHSGPCYVPRHLLRTLTPPSLSLLRPPQGRRRGSQPRLWGHSAVCMLFPLGRLPSPPSGPPLPYMWVGSPCAYEDVSVSFVTSPFQKQSYSDRAASLGTVHSQTGQGPAGGTLLCSSCSYLGASIWGWPCHACPLSRDSYCLELQILSLTQGLILAGKESPTTSTHQL